MCMYSLEHCHYLYALCGATKKVPAIIPDDRDSLLCLAASKTAASYSPALHCSTIGAGGLNFSVRNGKRWDPAAITT